MKGAGVEASVACSGGAGRLLWLGSGPEWGNWDVTAKEREGGRGCKSATGV